MYQIQRTTVLSAEGGVRRVEIAIADTGDIANAREAVTIVAAVSDSENPSLIDIQREALNRALALIGEATRGFGPARSA
jgi:hypothetical protein